MRAIDADALLKKTINNPLHAPYIVEKDIKEQPTIQPVATDTIVGDTISRQAAIDALDKRFDSIPMAQTAEILMLRKDLRNLPPAQPEHTCLTCGRTANNGGWYKDGRTRCPIEEHYALPKDGHCHLWEKQKPWEDDYPERRADAGK